MLRKSFCILLCSAILACSTGLRPTTAQQPEPPSGNTIPQQDADGRWYMPPAVQPAEQLPTSSQATGGPDDFGYTWNDGTAPGWVEATSGGTDAGLGGQSCGQAVGPISLPFTFKFYEKTYNQVWINAGGYLAFTVQDAHDCAPNDTLFPEPGNPSNMIAPLWSRYDLASGGMVGRVFYKSDGVAPNRRFIAEWNQVDYAWALSGVTNFTFEVILQESGDFRFEYKTINTSGGYYCSDIAIGIESWHGYDGLTYLNWCQAPASNKAVQFTRPADSARLQILNPYQGSFTRPNLQLIFPIKVVNTGTLGDDTYNLTTSSPWPVTFTSSTGLPLSDTTSDGIVDTGLIHQGELKTIVVSVQTPTIVSPASDNPLPVNLTSTRNPGRQKIAQFQSSVPVPFAQAYEGNEIGMYLFEPGGEVAGALPNYGYDIAIAEGPAPATPQSAAFAYAWSDGYENSLGNQVTEVWYTLMNRLGKYTQTPRVMFNHSAAAMVTYDSEPTVAVAQDGTIGITWYRMSVNSSGQRNENIYLAILNSSGDLIGSPLNLTNDTTWWQFNGLNAHMFEMPVIAATSDNRFTLTWWQAYNAATNDRVENIAYAIYNTAGGQVKAPAVLTNDGPGNTVSYSMPSVSALSGNKGLITYLKGQGSNNFDLWYTVLDSAGGLFFKPAINLSNDGTNYLEIGRADSVQAANGNTIVSWDVGAGLRYAALDTSYNLLFGPASISHPAMRFGRYNPISYLSLAADPTGHAVLTWMDADYNNSQRLYYALINDNGTVHTQAMIYKYAEEGIRAGQQSYGNTSYTINPTTSGTDTFVQAPSQNAVEPNGNVSLPIKFGNLGATSASTVTITTILGSGVDYVSDTSGITPTLSGPSTWEVPVSTQTVVAWKFPTPMDFLAAGRFDLTLGIVSAPLGTTFPVTLTIQTVGEGIPANNTAYLTLNAAEMLYLPVLVR